MADPGMKSPRNTPGRFYVDQTCIDCDACRQVAPDLIGRDDENGFSYFFRQPENEGEADLCQEAVDTCPTDSIGNDG